MVFPLSYMSLVALIGTAAALLALGCAIRSGLGWKCGALMAVLSPLLCLVCARGYYLLVCSPNPMLWYGPFLSSEPYDYAFGGGVLGFVLAVWLAARLGKKPFAQAGDVFAPVGLLAIAALRLAEALSDFGWGDFADAAWMQRYPFAIQNMYGEWCTAVFNLEALCALVILAVILLGGSRFRGRRLTVGLIWWAVTQIFCESLRVESIQWGFVRVQQLESALILAAVLAAGTRVHRRRALGSWGGFAVCVGLIIFIEYAIDKLPWPTYINYIAMAATVGLMGWCAQRLTLPAASVRAE